MAVEDARINFSISPYCTLLFSRKGNFKFFEVALPAVLCNGAVDWMCEDISIQILPTLLWTFTYFSKKGHKSTQTRCKVCSNPSSVLQHLTFVLLMTFINLEHILHSTLVLLFKIWKGKCWLKVCRELFVKIIQWC